MKFYGTPNMGVYEINRNRREAGNIYKRRKLLFRFDENGEYVTDDEKLIARLIKRFKHDETETAKTTTTETTEKTDEIKQRHCKKCEFTCETQGELLKHYREKHPKGGD